jgi:hypothetical protein
MSAVADACSTGTGPCEGADVSASMSRAGTCGGTELPISVAYSHFNHGACHSQRFSAVA